MSKRRRLQQKIDQALSVVNRHCNGRKAEVDPKVMLMRYRTSIYSHPSMTISSKGFGKIL
jgi:hypothetical protein